MELVVAHARPDASVVELVLESAKKPSVAALSEEQPFARRLCC